MKKIAVLFSGEGSNLQNLIDTLHQKECIIACALTNRADAGGITRAQEADIPVEILEHRRFSSREMFDAHLVATLRTYRVELSVMAGFMRIVTPVFTSQTRAINLHPSLLPHFKGAHAIERSFNSDEPYAGATVHFVTNALDGGTIILQRSFRREGHESLQQFHEKIRAIEYDILPKAVVKVLNTLK